MRIPDVVRRHPGWATALAAVGLGLFVFAMAWFTPWRLFTDDPVNEALPGTRPAAEAQPVDEMPGMMMTPAESAELAEGRFVSLEHQSRGRAVVIETADGTRFLRFEDFETSNGPDLVVYLSTKDADPNDWHGYDADFVDLGALKGNVGSQNYEIPGRRGPRRAFDCRGVVPEVRGRVRRRGPRLAGALFPGQPLDLRELPGEVALGDDHHVMEPPVELCDPLVPSIELLLQPLVARGDDVNLAEVDVALFPEPHPHILHP